MNLVWAMCIVLRYMPATEACSKMVTKMESLTSRISIPVKMVILGPVTAYARELAKCIGFDEADAARIQLAVEESLANVVQFGYQEETDDTLEIVFDSGPAGIVISIREKGIPFNPERLPQYSPDHSEPDASGAGLGIHLIKSFMDEVAFIRKGREGQEIRLTKHLPQKRINHLLPASEEKERHNQATLPEESNPPANYTIRRMLPKEALEVSKCAYRCYGYSYEDFAYYPERVAAMNREGTLYSLVAVTEDKLLMGHAALKYPYPGASIAESGVAFIYPRYRRLGLFSKFNDRFIERAREKGMHGLYGRAVTSHTASQRMAARHGYKDCGVFLGVFPADVDFKKIAGKTVQRESAALSYLPIQSCEPKTIYLPEGRRAPARQIFQSLVVPVNFQEGPSDADKSFSGHFSVEITKNHALNMAEIIVQEYGEYIFDQIRQQLKALCLERTDVIHVVLNLEDPGTESMVGRLEQLGLVFGGILPHGLGGRHALILQYLNNVKIDFDRINLVTPEALMILEAIKTAMPD